MPIPINTTTPPPTPTTTPGADTAGAVGEVFGRILSPSGGASPVLGAGIAILVVMLSTYFFLRLFLGARGLPRKLVYWIYYDPTLHSFRDRWMIEIAPNIYATRSGDLIAFGNQTISPINLHLPLKRVPRNAKALYGYKIGSLILPMDVVKEIQLSLFAKKLISAKNVAEILATLVVENVVSDIPINPSLRLVIQPDNTRLAQLLSESYGKLIEESIINITAMTGKRKDFETWVRQLVELEEKKLVTITSAVAKIIALLLIVTIILAGVMYIIR